MAGAILMVMEHWDSVAAWSNQLLKNNVGYRFVRYAELEDEKLLSAETTPLVLDARGCVSDKQFAAIKTYLAKGGTVWMALPFGTHDEKGFARKTALSEEIKKGKHKSLLIISSAVAGQTLQQLIKAKHFKPIIRQIKGDSRWAVRLRMFKDKPTIHFMNTALLPTPHPTIKDTEGVAVIAKLDSKIKDNDLAYEIDTAKFDLGELSVMSPELEATKDP